MEDYSAKIIRYRKAKGLTQEAMGKLLGVTGKYVGMIERKEYTPSEGTLTNYIDMLVSQLDNPAQPDLGDPLDGLKGRFLLKAAREQKGMTPKELAQAVGYSLSIYQDIEGGRSNMGEKMAEKIAKLLGVAKHDLLDGADEPPTSGGAYATVGTKPDINLPPGSKARYVPLLSMAQCGTMGAYDDSAYDHTGFLVINPLDSKAFSVESAGESMMPVISPGDIVTVYPSRSPKNNCMVLARLNDDHGADVMIKLYQAAQDQVTLISYNPLFPPMTYPREAFSWIYPVAQVCKVFLES
ncbi:MAG: LexA family transcriptional regulator [Verrucomicrobiota bacterium]